jgi:hypothetical protein
LDRLVEIVPKAKVEAVKPPDVVAEGKSSELTKDPLATDPTTETIREALWEPEAVTQEQLKGVPVRPIHLLLFVLTVAVVALALGYVLAPAIEKRWLSKTKSARVQPIPSTQSALTVSTKAKTPEDLRMLADQGNADAQWDMGARYHNGEGVPQDDTQAVQWFQRAADQGHVGAQATLGAYYWAGRGVPKDLSKAYFWSALALAQGDDGSKFRLEGLSTQMTRAQVTAAHQQADEWLRQHHAAK